MVQAFPVTGRHIYPHRPDLYHLNFWRCLCDNYVGCHPNSSKPLGCIPSPEMRNARKHIHELLDPLWQDGSFSRSELYRLISERIGKEYHTAEIRTIEEARDIYRTILQIKKENSYD
jgi:hypothetical protein